MILFETERLYVRHWEETDADNLFNLYSDPAVMQYIRAPLAKEESNNILSSQIAQYAVNSHAGRFAIIEKQTHAFIGSFLLKDSTTVRGIEIGYALMMDQWGKGFATEIVKAGLKFAFEIVKLPQVYAVTETGNVASKNVLIKCGFLQLDNTDENGNEVNIFLLKNPTS